MRISDWSSDVCSSDLVADKAGISGRGPKPAGEGRREPARELTRAQRHRVQWREIDKPPGEAMMQDDPIAVYRIAGGGNGVVHGRDRKSVVSGKSVSVRVDLGGRRTLKKKKKIK